MPVFYGAIDLSQNELRNARVQNLGTAPATPVAGQLWYDSTNNQLKWWNGSSWVVSTGGGTLTPAATVTTQAFADAAVVGTSANYAREDHKHGFPAHDAAAHAAIPLSALGVPSVDVNFNNHKVTNVTDPANPQDAATKAYVDNVSAGLSWKAPVRAATTANITLSGTQTIDGVSVVANDRVLVKNQTTASQNGVYVAAAGAWSRASDANAATEVLQLSVFVEEGSTQAETAWVCSTNAPITLDTTSLTFVQFSGAGTYTAGNGLTMTGNVIDVVAADTSITVAADAISVNTAVIPTIASLSGYAKKFQASLTGTSSPEVVTHNLNTQAIMLQVLNAGSPYTAVQVDWDATSLNTATIRYNPNLGAGYRVLVIG